MPVCLLAYRMCMHVCAGQKKVTNLLELELQVVVSYGIRVLGSKLGSFAKAICALNYWTISLAPYADIITSVGWTLKAKGN